MFSESEYLPDMVYVDVPSRHPGDALEVYVNFLTLSHKSCVDIILSYSIQEGKKSQCTENRDKSWQEKQRI